MSKNKKIIIGLVVGCILLGCIGFSGFYIYKLNKILTVLTIDINPSLKLSLNYKDKIIKVEGLNEDGINLLKEENFKGDLLEDAIEEIAELTVKKGYVSEEDNYILVNVEGKDIKEKVVTLIDKAFKEENVVCNVIAQEINANAKDMAEKYGLSESKASYIEEVIKENEGITFEELKDKSISEINKYVENKEEKNEEELKEEVKEEQEEDNKQNTTTNNNKNNNNKTNNTTSNNKTNNTSGGSGTTKKCEYVKHILTNEEAGKKVASLMGATVGTGKYCDKLPPESVVALTSDGTCAYRVTFAHRTKSCVYYVGLETGNILGEPSCTSKTVEEGEAQCIIMESMNITAREQFYASNLRDNGSEWIYDVEDVYGEPDENGKRYVYEYHVSKSTGLIASKTMIRELQ